MPARIALTIQTLLPIALGLSALLWWQPHGFLQRLDAWLSPIKNERFQIGAKIEDQRDPTSRDRVTRKVVAPTPRTLDYVVCQIDDDPEQVNAFGLYHPADLAITLSNLQNQGVERVFISTHLHWPELESQETNTIATALKPFLSAVVTTPVGRKLSGDPIPPAFLRASIPQSAVDGSSELFPKVNALAIPPNVDFPENTLAGFSTIESEESSTSIPLLARWDDRIVFAAPLLTLMQHCRVSPSEIHIESGQFIRIGNTGNILPIDAFGYFQQNPNFTPNPPPRTITSALSGEASIIGATQPNAILTATGSITQKFEAIESPYETLSMLDFSPRVSSPHTLHRLPQWLEIALVILLALLTTMCRHTSKWRSPLNFLLLLAGTGLCLIALYHTLNYWSPASPLVLTILTGWTLSLIPATPARLPKR